MRLDGSVTDEPGRTEAERHPELADLIAAAREAITDRGGAAGPILIGIDGRSGSGKTASAAALATALRRTVQVPPAAPEVTVIPLEAMYRGWDGLAAGLAPLCAELIGPLLTGRTGGYNSWDWHAGRAGPRVTVAPAPVLILEGVGALSLGCADRFAVRAWIEAPEPLRKRRALDRDGSTYAPHWDRWAAQEDALFADGRARAAATVLLGE